MKDNKSKYCVSEKVLEDRRKFNQGDLGGWSMKEHLEALAIARKLRY